MNDIPQIFNDALLALNAGDIARAEKLFRQVVEADSSHAPALNLLVVVLMSMERFAEAEPFIMRATALNQNSDVSFYNFGLISKRLNKPQQALKNFDKALELNPNVAETWNNRGTILNDLKRYDLAVSDFEKAISLNGAYAEAYANKGKSLTLLKRYDEAFAAYDKALSIKPDLENAWLGRGNIFTDLKRYDEAFAAYDKALSIRPDLEGAWLGRGNVFTVLKRYDEAFAAYDKALSIKPDLEGAWIGRGNVFADLKCHDEAFAAYDKALSIKPDLADAWLGRGNVFWSLKRYDEAFAAYGKALSIKPDLADAWLGRGNFFWSLKRYDEAVAAYDKALSIKPDLEGAWLGRGNVLSVLKRYDEAFAAYDKTLSIKPDLEGAWLGRGNVFTDLKRYDEAFAAYDKALSIKPDLEGAWIGRGNVFTAQNRDTEALKCLDRAIEIDPLFALTHFNRSLVLLKLGEYADAWEEYEWRKKLPVPLGNRTFTQPCLLDTEGIEGATVFVYGEQGLGDYIHFCRYAKLAADKGAKVILEAPKSLFQLFKSLDGVSQLIEVGQSVPPFDYHCPVMSLPRAFRTTLENVPNKVPYLFAEPEKVKAWASKLGAKSKLRIGLVWSGGFRPNQPELWSTNERRNIPLTKLAPLLDLDAAFYSLQKGDQAVSELKRLATGGLSGSSIIDWTDELHDFSDTAAFVENLDVVVSVDTSTAHLAGAMAKPVCLLNRFDIEWRWLPNSPWYPTVKPYIQTAAGNWDQVIENLKTDLISTLSSTRRNHLLLCR